MVGHPLCVVESWFRFKVDELQKIAGQKKTAGGSGGFVFGSLFYLQASLGLIPPKAG
jgi:hypothetical protein